MTDHSSEALKSAIKNSNFTTLLSALADGETLINGHGTRIAIRNGAICYINRDGSCTNEVISATSLFSFFNDKAIVWAVEESEIDFLRSLLVTVNAARFSDSEQRWPIHQQIHRRITTLETAK
jgi:hypothetical protein